MADDLRENLGEIRVPGESPANRTELENGVMYGLPTIQMQPKVAAIFPWSENQPGIMFTWNIMGKRAWLVFIAIQTAGCVFASYGTVYSESWFVGFLLLLPGDLSAQAVSHVLIHWRTAYVFIPVAVASNCILWMTLSGAWRILRRSNPKEPFSRYCLALAVAGLTFVIANTIQFLRPITCDDCFFPYGVPFTLYHEGGYAGGAGIAWAGLAADAGCVVAAGLIVGRIWEALSTRREKHVPVE